jgi:hypothetical protein
MFLNIAKLLVRTETEASDYKRRIQERRSHCQVMKPVRYTCKFIIIISQWYKITFRNMADKLGSRVQGAK